MNVNAVLLGLLANFERSYAEHEQMIFTVKDAQNLISHGESFIAFENILDNLYEFEIPLSLGDIGVIEEIAKCFEMSNDRYANLYEQVKR